MGNPDSSSSPPPQQDWQSQPQQPAPPPPAAGQPASSGLPSWTSNITAQGEVTGPAGLALADLPKRIIAWVIDGVIVAIAGYVIGAITTSVLGDTFTFGGIFVGAVKTASAVSSVAAVALMLALTAGYFIYTWLKMDGASLGMRVLKLQLRDATSGGAISQNQAITRWALLWAPAAVFWGLWGWGIFGLVAAIALAAWEVYLLVTAAQSPTRQGLHDVRANTVVAKVG